ncbi:hypothetical protein BK123_02370 [Paenibacillus lautus]|uniref:Uncharacterized protein n=1 Tax=Paenibacillus lautus TaxID=1401 RepID=A0A1R1B8K6_PAELA|nr:hypothetical protein BK123_02370 [Paenibacillus lautus]
MIPGVKSIEYYTIPVQDSILILYKRLILPNLYRMRFSADFLYDFGIKFVITMDNDVKMTGTSAIFLRLTL